MGLWQSITESHWKWGHGLRDLRKCQEGEIYFRLKGQQRLFGELELGLSWEKDQGWVDRKNRATLQGGGDGLAQTTEGATVCSGLKTCRDLERVFLGNAGEKTTNTQWPGHQGKWCSIKPGSLGLRVTVSWKLSWLVNYMWLYFSFSHPSLYREVGESGSNHHLRPSAPWLLKQFGSSFPASTELQLPLEQHRFEWCRSTYTYIFSVVSTIVLRDLYLAESEDSEPWLLKNLR